MSIIISLSEFLARNDDLDIPIVASIVNSQNKIISIASNYVEKKSCEWMHAEFMAVSLATDFMQTRYLENCSIYVTLEPCNFCFAMLQQVRIANIFFGAYNQKYGALFHTSQKIPNIIGGIQEQRCAKIINKFFKKIRNSGEKSK